MSKPSLLFLCLLSITTACVKHLPVVDDDAPPSNTAQPAAQRAATDGANDACVSEQNKRAAAMTFPCEMPSAAAPVLVSSKRFVSGRAIVAGEFVVFAESVDGDDSINRETILVKAHSDGSADQVIFDQRKQHVGPLDVFADSMDIYFSAVSKTASTKLMRIPTAGGSAVMVAEGTFGLLGIDENYAYIQEGASGHIKGFPRAGGAERDFGSFKTSPGVVTLYKPQLRGHTLWFIDAASKMLYKMDLAASAPAPEARGMSCQNYAVDDAGKYVFCSDKTGLTRVDLQTGTSEVVVTFDKLAPNWASVNPRLSVPTLSISQAIGGAIYVYVEGTHELPIMRYDIAQNSIQPVSCARGMVSGLTAAEDALVWVEDQSNSNNDCVYRVAFR